MQKHWDCKKSDRRVDSVFINQCKNKNHENFKIKNCKIGLAIRYAYTYNEFYNKTGMRRLLY